MERKLDLQGLEVTFPHRLDESKNCLWVCLAAPDKKSLELQGSVSSAVGAWHKGRNGTPTSQERLGLLSMPRKNRSTQRPKRPSVAKHLFGP